MANTTIVRVTKAQKFDGIIALLEGKAPITIPGKDGKEGVVLDAAYLCGFCKDEKGLLAKKNSGDKKPTKTQEENEGFKAKILDFLGQQTEGKTCTEILKGIPEFADFNNQKVAALVRQLADSGKVEKATVKGKSLFSLALTEDEDE